MPEPSDKILHKVRTLLDKAESSEFPAEADALQAKAFELMSLYGIEQAVLAAEGKREDVIGPLTIDLPGAYAIGRASLLNQITEALGARGLYLAAGKNRQVGSFIVIGHETTRERVEFLFTLLFAQATGGISRITGRTPGQVRSARASYLLAFSTAIGTRLRDAEGRARSDETVSSSGTVALLRRRDLDVDATFGQMYPRVRMIPMRARSRVGFDAGTRDGQRADLGGTRFGNGRAKAIGQG